jgi:hypothetical protein
LKIFRGNFENIFVTKAEYLVIVICSRKKMFART